MSVRVTGSPGGDGDAFCFYVTVEEYRRLMGDENYHRELREREEDALLRQAGLEPGEYEAEASEQCWRIYPDDLLRLLGVEGTDPVTIEIGVV